MKPTIIYISGAPGSGKTTLAQTLSRQLNIPQISSDLVHGGVAMANPSHDRGETIKNIFVPHLINTAKLGISVVVDQVLQKPIAKETIIDKLLPHAHLIYLHVQASDPIARYKQNVEQHDSLDVQERREFLISRAEFHANNLENTVGVLELGVPTLVINTNNGYSPSLEEIITFIKKNTPRN